MAGLVTHRWNGTVLTITSDSGTSSMDLAGPKGDKGCRGPQGRCGVILDADGVIETDGYATEEYVDNQIAAIELLPGPMGPSGVDGTVAFDELTDAQRASLKGDKGDKGDAFTYEDFTEEQLAGLVGPQGPDGNVAFDELTDAQKASLKGEKGDKGDKGDTYTLTAADKQDIADLISLAIVDGNEVYY